MSTGLVTRTLSRGYRSRSHTRGDILMRRFSREKINKMVRNEESTSNAAYSSVSFAVGEKFRVVLTFKRN